MLTAPNAKHNRDDRHATTAEQRREAHHAMQRIKEAREKDAAGREKAKEAYVGARNEAAQVA